MCQAPILFIKRLLTGNTTRRLSDPTSLCQASSRSKRQKSASQVYAQRGVIEAYLHGDQRQGCLQTGQGFKSPSSSPWSLSGLPSAGSGLSAHSQPGLARLPLHSQPGKASWPPCSLSKAFLHFTGSRAYPYTSQCGTAMS